MNITYEVGTGLYVNVTNRCTNRCKFCVRSVADGTYGELWLQSEPTAEDILEDIFSRDLSKYSELVFCGYGEPTIRLNEILWVAARVKEKSDIKIRINTNGHANLIHKKDVTPLFENIIDSVSVSMNTASVEDYLRVCYPDFGGAAYYGLFEFAKNVKKYVPEVTLSVVRGTILDSDIEKCRELADSYGVPLKIREYIK